MVTLYIVRHAIAADRGDEWPDDGKRPLIDRGIDRFTEGVAGLVALAVAVDVVFTSPLVRAKQTADLLANGLSGSPPVKTIGALAPGHAPPEMLEQVAREARGRTRVAVVGHEPDLGLLAAHLIGARRPITFKKGGACRIDMDRLSAREGTLVWLATPRMLRRLS